MAGILARFKDIMESNINALLDKAEDTDKMVEQLLRNAEENLGKVKSETAAVMATEKSSKRKLDECVEDIVKYENYAKKALQAGNEGDAKQFITKKQEKETSKITLEEAHKIAYDAAENMKAMHDKLCRDIESLRDRKDTIKNTNMVAKTKETINKMTGASVSSANKSIDAFARMEEKANKRLDEANAAAELAASTNSMVKLEEKYDYGSDSDVDDELAKMKAELGV